MNKRPEITALLSLSIQKHINPHNDTRIYWAREVTFDYATSNAVRVDYMQFKPVSNTVSGIEKGDVYCYEVKSSAEDFHSKNGHNFLGDYNYYVMSEDVYEKVSNEIPYYVGVFVPDGMHYLGEWYNLKSAKKAKRRDRSRPVCEILLMMFRSARRDDFKREKSDKGKQFKTKFPIGCKCILDCEDMRIPVIIEEYFENLDGEQVKARSYSHDSKFRYYGVSRELEWFDDKLYTIEEAIEKFGGGNIGY